MLSIESTIMIGRILPVFRFKFKSIIEEIFSFDELSFVPFSNIAALVIKVRKQFY